jgi:ionotropic glutamate receptor
LQVFPRGSPFVADVSRAILNVTEGEKKKEIENAWLGKDSNCLDSNPKVSSDSLSLSNFWGLFLIAGVASLSALIVSVCMFLYKERGQILTSFGNSKGSIQRKFWLTLRIFDKKDLNSHTSRKRALEEKSGIDTGTSEPAPNTNCPASPSSHSTCQESHFGFLGDPGTPCREYADLNPNDQMSQPAVIEIIVDPNQEVPRIPGISYESS